MVEMKIGIDELADGGIERGLRDILHISSGIEENVFARV